jgi:hypothetical protein
MAMLDALNKKASPEDDRTLGQRNHDALEEAARMLLLTGKLPDIAGQPAQMLVHASLDQILDLLGAQPGPPRAASTGTANTAAVDPEAADAEVADPEAADAEAASREAAGAGPDADVGAASMNGRAAGSAARSSDGSASWAGPGMSCTPGGSDGLDIRNASYQADSAATAHNGGRSAGGYLAGTAGAFAAGRAAGDGEPGWLASAVAAQACACDAKIATVVTGHIDPEAVAAAVQAYLTRQDASGCVVSRDPDQGQPGQESPAWSGDPPGDAGPIGSWSAAGRPPALTSVGPSGAGPARAGAPDERLRAAPGQDRLQSTLIRYATAMLSGPAGLASVLRSGLPGPLGAAVSLPLDITSPTATVPPHLRRAVIVRDRRCAFPGCTQSPARCQVHHIIPRSRGGPTSLANLVLLCGFHQCAARRCHFRMGVRDRHLLAVAAAG